MWETILIDLIVLAAALYAAWRLSPAGLRLRSARRIAEWGRRPGRPAWLTHATQAVEAAAGRAVGACSDCGTARASPSQPPSQQPPRE